MIVVFKIQGIVELNSLSVTIGGQTKLFGKESIDCLLIHNGQIHKETTITYLARACSDHTHMLLNMRSSNTTSPKYFKFLDFWVKHKDFIYVVQKVWDEPTRGNLCGFYIKN